MARCSPYFSKAIRWPYCIAFSYIMLTSSVAEAVVGGADVSAAGKYPSFSWNQGKLQCGGSLIYPDVVLTAAHCLGQFGPGIFVDGVYANGTDIATDAVGVAYEYVHPTYTFDAEDHDIMLVKLERNSTKPVQTISYLDPPGGSTTRIVGYGRTGTDDPTSEILQEVGNLTVISNAECDRIYGGGLVFSNHLCIRNVPGKDGCQHDSGGPLLDERQLQIGIVVWKDADCGDTNFPTVFTHLSQYKDWIKQGICELSASPPTDCQARREPPGNSECENAETAVDKLVGTTFGGSVAGRLSECPNLLHTGPGVWYKVAGTGGSMTVRRLNNGTDYYTKISVFEGKCSDLVCIGGNQHDFIDEGIFATEVTWNSELNNEYHIMVHSNVTGQSLEFSMSLTSEVHSNGNGQGLNFSTSGVGCCLSVAMLIGSLMFHFF